MVCVAAITASYAAYCYRNMDADLQNRARTTTDYFKEAIGQDYDTFYQSCITYAETFDQADFLRKVAACPECPKSACPSPESYRNAFDWLVKANLTWIENIIWIEGLLNSLHNSYSRWIQRFLQIWLL